MIELKTYDINLSVYKHAATDTDHVVFLSGFPKTYDIYTFKQGIVNEDLLQLCKGLSIVFGVHIAISDDKKGKKND